MPHPTTTTHAPTTRPQPRPATPHPPREDSIQPGGGTRPGGGGTRPGQSPGDTPPGGPPQRPQVDPERIANRANALHNAMSGWGTDEDAVMNALRDLSPAEMSALRREYRDRFQGANLDSTIRSELSGGDLREANGYLSGDRVTGAVERLQNQVGVFNDDEAGIEDTLRSLSPTQLRELQRRMDDNPQVRASIDGVLEHLGGEDREVADALLSGDRATASAVRIDEAMRGLGTDEEAINRYLEGARTPEERAAIEQAYNARLQQRGESESLRSNLRHELSGTDQDLSEALLRGDAAGAAAARMEGAARGLGTDEEAIYGQLRGRSATERQQIQLAYQNRYGRSVSMMMRDEMGGDDLTRGQMLRRDGRVDEAFALHTAMDGLGTDEEALRSTLQGKSAAEIAALEASYRQRYGVSLRDQLDGELSGRDHFEIANQAMQGRAETAEQVRAQANERYAFERSGAFSNAVMDAGEFLGLHDNGSQLDYMTGRINGLFHDGERRDGVSDAYAVRLGNWQQSDTANYVSSKNAATDAMATGAEITAAAGATYLTGGAASPWLAAAIAGGSGLAGMGTRYAMQGDAYGWESAAVDLGRTGVNAATAGLMSTGGAERAFTGLAERGASQLGRMSTMLGGEGTQAFLGAGARSATEGVAGSLYDSAINDDRWRAGVGDYVGGMVGDATQAAGTGFLSGGAGGLAGSRYQDSLTYGDLMRQQMATGVASGVVSTALDSQTWDGRAEDVVGRFGQSAAVSAGRGALDGALERHTRANVAFRRATASGATAGEIAQVGEDMRGYTHEEQQSIRHRVLAHALENPEMGSLGAIHHRIENPPAIVRAHEEEEQEEVVEER